MVKEFIQLARQRLAIAVVNVLGTAHESRHCRQDLDLPVSDGTSRDSGQSRERGGLDRKVFVKGAHQ
jgi:hypothetical protein